MATNKGATLGSRQQQIWHGSLSWKLEPTLVLESSEWLTLCPVFDQSHHNLLRERVRGRERESEREREREGERGREGGRGEKIRNWNVKINTCNFIHSIIIIIIHATTRMNTHHITGSKLTLWWSSQVVHPFGHKMTRLAPLTQMWQFSR